MDNKAFVFTGFAFLMVIPAIILAASLFNMMYYGSTGIAISMVSDEVFYGCQNLISFLQDASRDGQREYAMAQAALYASEHGLNYTNITINATFFKILLETPGFTCNKTVELRFGTLRVNLTLYGWNTTVDGLPVYFRRVRNNILNTSTYVTFPNSSAVSGANVTLDILNESFKNTTDATGYYWKTLNITKYVDTTDACTRKTYLGQHSAEATASFTNYYDGSDSESFRILGDMSSSTAEGFTSGSGGNRKLGVRITLVDEYGDPVTEYPITGCGPQGNYTSPLPTITARIYEGSISPDNLKASYVSPINITEKGKSSGVYETAPGISFTVSADYYATVNASSADYLSLNWQGKISFTDLEATTVYNQSLINDGFDECKFTGTLAAGIVLNVTNVGTTSGKPPDTTINNYIVVYKYCDGGGCDKANVSTFKTYATRTYGYPSGQGGQGGNWLVCAINNTVPLSSGNVIFANITSVNTPNIDKSLGNNLVNSTV